MSAAAAVTAAAAAVDAWCAAQTDLATERLDPRSWATVLAGEQKRTVPVHLSVGANGLLVQSFFMAAPDEGRDEVFAGLLRRHTRTYTCRFALDDRGDVLLVAVLPLAAVTVEELDRTLGQLLVAADETYPIALRAGFPSYIEREQAWREAVGLPRNPIT